MMNSRRALSLTFSALLLLSSCSLSTCSSSTPTSTATAGSNPGQLFCALQTEGGGTIVAALVDATVAANPSTAAFSSLAVLATGATKQFVDAACAQAAVNTNSKAGVAVSPPILSPTVAVPVIAIVPPKV
jgi:hypothetical protein